MTTFFVEASSVAVRATAVAALAFACSGFGGSAIASAAPKEWNIEYYDDCMDVVRLGYMAGEYTTAEMGELVSMCCDNSGGVEDGGDCSAPPGVAAPSTPTTPPSEAANPDVPAGPAPPPKTGPKSPTPRTTFTLAPLVPSAPVG